MQKKFQDALIQSEIAEKALLNERLKFQNHLSSLRLVLLLRH